MMSRQSTKSWKQSGNHDNFDDAVSRVADNFVNRNWVLLYMHEFMYAHPAALLKMTGELPKGRMTESVMAPFLFLTTWWSKRDEKEVR
jgi:hypothetical protein